MATVLDTLIARINFRIDNQSLDRLDRRLNTLSNSINKVANVALAIGTGLTAGSVGVIKKFAEYETVLAKIEGLVGVSRDQLDAWQGDIKRIAANSGQSMTAVAEALFFITSAGYKGAEAIDILEKSAMAANAGLGEQTVIADLLTSALGVYSDGTLDAAMATDQLVAAIREGKLDPQTLAKPLAQVLPFAQQVGVSFGEVAGAMAAMSRQGIPATRSATALRGMFAKMLKPTAQGKKALEEVGLTMEDLRKVIDEEGLMQGLLTLQTAFDGNSEAMGRVFEDVEALLGVFALTGTAAEENAEIIDRVSNAVGDLDAALKPVLNTLQNRWNTVMSRAGSAMIEMGQLLAPMAHQFLDFAMVALDFFDSLDDGTKQTIAELLALGPAILAVGVALKGLAIILGAFVPAIVAAKVAIKAFSVALIFTSKVAISGLLASLAIAVHAIRLFGIAMLFASKTAIKGFILALVATKLALKGFATALIFTSKVALRGLVLALTTTKLALKAFQVALIFTSKVALRGFVLALAGAKLSLKGLQAALLLLSSAGLKGLGLALAGSATAIKTVKTALKALFLLMRANPIGILITAISAIIIYWDEIVAAMIKVGEVFTDLMEKLGIPVGDILAWLIDAWQNVMQVMSKIGDTFINLMDKFGIPIQGIFDWLVDAWHNVMQAMLGLIPEPILKLLQGAGDILGSVSDTGKKLVQGIGDGIGSAADGLAEKTKGAFSKIKDLLPQSDAREGPLSKLTSSGQSIMTTLADGVRIGQPELSRVLANSLDGLALNPIDIPGNLLDGLSNMNLTQPDLLNNLVEGLQPLPVGPHPAQIDAIQPIGQGIPNQNQSIELTIDKIEINTQGGNPQEIADKLSGELKDQLRRAVETADTRILA